MPELPDIELYVTRLRERVVGETLRSFKTHTPFVLHSLARPAELDGLEVLSVSRLGKRLVFSLERNFFLVLHLMIAGRLSWVSPVPPEHPRRDKALLATLQFDKGRLTLVEHSTKKRASIFIERSLEALQQHQRRGVDVLNCSQEEFERVLKHENRTLKRALTDPNSFDGIGNAYSDEILFASRLSPMLQTHSLDPEQMVRLRDATRETIQFWCERLLQLYPEFPKPGQVTAFRSDFAVHGKYGRPCKVCGSPIQRIVYADTETNYCAKCQNGGKLLADRGISRLLKEDRPKTLDDL